MRGSSPTDFRFSASILTVVYEVVKLTNLCALELLAFMVRDVGTVAPKFVEVVWLEGKLKLSALKIEACF